MGSLLSPGQLSGVPGCSWGPPWAPQPHSTPRQDAEVVRTRDPQRLAQCDVVVDVGGEYDPERHRYDHHQR